MEHDVATTAAATGKRLGLVAPVLYVYNRHTKRMEVEIVQTYLLVAMQDMYRTRVRGKKRGGMPVGCRSSRWSP